MNKLFRTASFNCHRPKPLVRYNRTFAYRVRSYTPWTTAYQWGWGSPFSGYHKDSQTGNKGQAYTICDTKLLTDQTAVRHLLLTRFRSSTCFPREWSLNFNIPPALLDNRLAITISGPISNITVGPGPKVLFFLFVQSIVYCVAL